MTAIIVSLVVALLYFIILNNILHAPVVIVVFIILNNVLYSLEYLTRNVQLSSFILCVVIMLNIKLLYSCATFSM